MSLFSTSKPAAISLPHKDIEVVEPPNDSITRVSFSPTADILAVASWNGEVRLYDVGPNRETRPRAMYRHEGPILDICWSNDGTYLFSASADKTARGYSVPTEQSIQVAAHAEAVSAIRWINAPSGGYLATSSWDQTLKYWNLGDSTPIASVNLPERCYAMDVAYPLLVVATADRHVIVINLAKPTTVFQQIVSPLKWATRTVACFPTANGWAMGGIDGRLAIQHVDEKDKGQNFSFKCHRQDSAAAKSHTVVFGLNNICFHQEHGTFVTCGSDGTISSWDHTSKIRLAAFEGLGGPVVSSSYNRTGRILAYAVAYDWGKGYTGMTLNHPNKVLLHACTDEEVKKRRTKLPTAVLSPSPSNSRFAR